MLDYLDTEIEKRRAEIAKIKAEQQELRQREHDFGVELRVLEDIRARSIRDETPAPLAEATVNASQVNTLAGPTPTVTRSKLAAHWRVVLRAAVERFPEGIKTQEVPEIQRAAGHDASPAPNVRSHFHKLRHEGLYEEAGWGTVRATKAAAELLRALERRTANHSSANQTEKRRDVPTKLIPPLPSIINQGGPNGTALAKSLMPSR